MRSLGKAATATLALADGSVFRGHALGASAVGVGELCFNTSLTGYQEIMTDPSYAGQIVTMTYTQIGNVGMNQADCEASRIHLSAFVVKEAFDEPSNWRAEGSLHQWLQDQSVPAIEGIDTRALVRRVRTGGAQTAVVSTDPAQQNAEALVQLAKQENPLEGVDWVSRVTTREAYSFKEQPWGGVDGQLPPAVVPEEKLRLVAYDFGVKRNILRLLVAQGFDVTVVPASTSAEDALALQPDAIFLSNGPGDPASVLGVQEHVAALAEQKPLFGICLGHQILGLALGGTTHKLKFGHHGGNQPGKDLASGKISICAENHGYAVSADSLRSAGESVEVTHINLNDNTVEGLAHLEKPIFSVQYHPEASPGPHDASYFFGRFREMAARVKAGQSVSGADIAKGC